MSLVPVVTIVMLSVLAFIVLSVVIAPPDAIDANGTPLPYNFKSERGSVTLLSSGMFLVAARLAGSALRLVWAGAGRPRTMWLVFTGLMSYFSVDEVLQFHEKSGDFLDAHFPTGPFRTYNDVVVIVYGVLALPAAALLWREVIRYHRLLTMLVISGVLYVATTGVDTFTTTATYSSTILEEGIKVCCSSFFALSMLTGLVATRWLVTLGTAAPAPASALTTSGGTLTAARRAMGVIWLAVLGLMAVIALLVAFVGRGEARVLLNWLAALPAGAAIIAAVQKLGSRE